MSPPAAQDERLLDELRQLATRFAVAADETSIAGLARYVDLLHLWNARINLTGARTPQAIVREQLPDSFALAALVPPDARLVDVGSGGGLPAIPFGLLRRDVALTLVEPRSRRRAFLTTALRELSVPAELRDLRAEQLPAGQFTAASARAVLPPDEWLAEGSRLVIPEGLVFLFLGEAPWNPPVRVEVKSERRYDAGSGSHRLVAVARQPG